MAEPQNAGVLIVDDSQVMRQMLHHILTEAGLKVVGEAADGEKALKMYEQLNPDLVTLDIVMPKMRGTEVLEKIMASHPEARIIMATSVSDARTVMHCLKLGAKQYIIKPYDQVKIMEAVTKALAD